MTDVICRVICPCNDDVMTASSYSSAAVAMLRSAVENVADAVEGSVRRDSDPEEDQVRKKFL